MNNPRDILNELKWREEYDLKKTLICYIHRGAQNNTKTINGEDIVKIEKSFIQIKTAMIPFHRILKITYNDKILFERQKIKN
jgi:uncharacterized protein (UPF0248 family)